MGTSDSSASKKMYFFNQSAAAQIHHIPIVPSNSNNRQTLPNKKMLDIVLEVSEGSRGSTQNEYLSGWRYTEG